MTPEKKFSNDLSLIRKSARLEAIDASARHKQRLLLMGEGFSIKQADDIVDLKRRRSGRFG